MVDDLQPGRHYAVLDQAGLWHIAVCEQDTCTGCGRPCVEGVTFVVVSDGQAGDRWWPSWVKAWVLLPDREET